MLRIKLSLLLIALILFSESIIAQQNPCVKIESILVAACTSTGSPEGSNEMMRFSVGDQDLNTADMFITWGSGQYGWSGLAQNQNTANIVAAFNNTIQSCGFILEPTNGVLPANSQVIIITGTSTSTTANSFAALSDTIYMLFHNATNPGGHFLNYTAPPPPFGQTLDQPTTISFSSFPGCTNTATYFRDQLIMQNGMIGNEPGSTVLFDANMNPTYINNGCIASINILSPSWNSPGTVCETDPGLNLNTFITGTPGGFWTGQGIADSIFNPSGLAGAIEITYNVVNEACADTLSNTQIINVIQNPDASFSLPDTICNYDSPLQLNNFVTGDAGGTFSGTGVFQNSFNPAGINGPIEIIYNVGSGNCQATSTQSIEVIALPLPELSSTEGNYCPGEETEIIEILNAGDATGVWYGTPGLDIPIAQGNTFAPSGTSNNNYFVTLNLSGCVSEPASYAYNYFPLETIIEADVDDPAEAPYTLNAFNQSTDAVSCQWFLDDEPIEDVVGFSLSLLFETEGQFVLKLVCENEIGCTDVDSIIINVIDKTVLLNIPNVFTPNGDNVNDLFTFDVKGITQMSGRIFNRWGKIVYEWEGLEAYWDGKINDQDAPSGTYFFVVDTTDIFDETKQSKGTVTLVR